MSDADAPTEREKAAFAPFRPRRARAVALGVSLAAVVIFGVLALLLPGRAGGAIWGPADQVMFFGIGIVIALLAWRYAAISAIPSREGLVVRNLVLTRTLEWPEIVGVQFGGGEPWVQLDLDSLETLAVMAIQKADGPFAMREASRLAALVAGLGERREPSGPDDSDDSDDSGRLSESGDDE
ncbi:MAG: PH domain-containing protein [Micrococcales bacterium]|nr:PH domain-containing protein [Micrococcales bacterium]